MSLNSLELVSRGTGRTTRMLQAAIDAASTGKRVLVVAADISNRVRLMQQLEQMGWTGKNIEVLSAYSVEMHHFDWDHFRLYSRNYSPEDIYIDHFAIHARFNRILTEYHRYDQK